MTLNITTEKKNLKIVVIGGGTGSYTLLKGLKRYFTDITSIVTMFDSGGSSGILRDEFGYLPPGDVRRAILALCDENAHPLFRQLIDYRFTKGASLNGHNFGNLLLTALTEITGSEVNAIRSLSDILKIQGKVLPVSTTNSNLVAELADGVIISGETNIDLKKDSIRIKNIFLSPEALAHDESIKALEEADVVIIGPGDLYTSIIPNLVTKGISLALKNSKAKKIYICNVMSKLSETHGYKASEYLSEIERYANCSMNFMIVNSKEITDKDLLKKYADELKFPVAVDKENLEKKETKTIYADVINESHLIRHDSEKLANVVVEIVNANS